MKLSIITINLNNCNGLEKTIKSVVSQDYSDYEYIIIDGGSTDNSVNIIKRNSNKITTWISEIDTGIYNAMNKGITLANGEYCLFLNSGDVLTKDSILSEIFSNNLKEDIIYGSIIYNSSGNLQLFEYPAPNEIDFSFFQRLSLPHPSSLIKKNVFARIGHYNESLKIVGDWEFFLKAICKHNTTIKKIPYAITIYDTTGLSSEKENELLINLERKKVLEDGYGSFLDKYSYKKEGLNLKKRSSALRKILSLFQKSDT